MRGWQALWWRYGPRKQSGREPGYTMHGLVAAFLVRHWQARLSVQNRQVNTICYFMVHEEIWASGRTWPRAHQNYIIGFSLYIVGGNEPHYQAPSNCKIVCHNSSPHLGKRDPQPSKGSLQIKPHWPRIFRHGLCSQSLANQNARRVWYGD